MMLRTATITKAGQITVPKWVRETLGVQPGQRVVFRRIKGAVAIEKEKDARQIAEEIEKLIPDSIKKHHMEQYAGMSSTEMQEKWAKSPEAHQYFEDEFRRTL